MRRYTVNASTPASYTAVPMRCSVKNKKLHVTFKIPLTTNSQAIMQRDASCDPRIVSQYGRFQNTVADQAARMKMVVHMNPKNHPGGIQGGFRIFRYHAISAVVNTLPTTETRMTINGITMYETCMKI